MSGATELAAGSLPRDIETPRSKLVYLYLVADGPSTARDLRTDLDMGLISLFPVLRGLVRAGHVRRESGTYRPAD